MPYLIRHRWPLLAFLVLLATTWAAYHSGLSGGFLFDDFPNLSAIGSTGPVDDWPTFWRYLTSGSADPTGRPLSLLSFLLDARDWPADPAPFLRTNLLLHLFNGALLFALLRALGRHLDGVTPKTEAAALLGAGLWLLHPLLVSTTLYIVQRHAMLPATFVLLGLLAYVHGRAMFVHAPRTGTTWMVAGIFAGTALAVLCKANGILLPLLAWVLESTVLRGTALTPAAPVRQRQLRWLRMGLLVVPSVLVFAYLASFLLQLDIPIDRPWTIAQRLLTEPRVLLDYLYLLLVPRVLSTGLYNDDYAASTGWLHPLTTLPALLAIVALIVVGFALRRRKPALAAALLFFFAGHLLESTVIALELYFEHRNYLPSLLLFWPLARALCAWRAPLALRVTAATTLLAICALTTHQRAALWGQPEQMARLWALQNPGSARAQATAATFDLKGKRPDLALQRIHALWLRQPHDLQLALNYANAACALRGLRPEEIAAIAQALRHATAGDQLVHSWLGRALDIAANERCAGLDHDATDTWLAAVAANPLLSKMPGRQQDLESLQGRVALQRGEYRQALAHFDLALAAWTTPGAAARQAVMLAEAGQYGLALAHLDQYERLKTRRVRVTVWNMSRLQQWVLDYQEYWPRELAILRGKLEAEINAQAATSANDTDSKRRSRADADD